MTTRSRRATSARATSSVVVPTLTITEQPSGIISAARCPIARFSGAATLRARRIGDVGHPRRRHRPAMDAREQAVLAQVVEIAPDRLGRDLELGRQRLHLDPPLRPRPVQDFGLPFTQKHAEPGPARGLARGFKRVDLAEPKMTAFIRKSNFSLDRINRFQMNCARVMPAHRHAF